MIFAFIFLFFILCNMFLWIFWCLVSLSINKNEEYFEPSVFYNWTFVLWYKYMLKVARIKVRVSGLQKIPNNQRFLLVSNHCSKFDNFIQCAILNKTQLAFVSKYENFKLPIVGRFMRRGLYLSLQWGNLKQASEIILKAANIIKDDKVSIGIFPEGTRSKDGKIKEFKPGAFKIAQKSKCPVVICSLKNTLEIHKNWPLKRTIVYMDILDVIDSSVWQIKNTVEVSKNVHDLIMKNLDAQ